MLMEDPISYPTVKINGQEVELKFRCGDVIRMKKAGIDFFSLGEARKGVDAVEFLLNLLSHCVAHKMDVTAEQLGNMIDYSPEQMHLIDIAIGEAIKKASARASVPTTVPAAATE